MIDMTKLRNPFHIAVGYAVGYTIYFNKLAEWVLYFRVTTTTSGAPPRIKFNFPLDAHK